MKTINLILITYLVSFSIGFVNASSPELLLHMSAEHIKSLHNDVWLSKDLSTEEKGIATENLNKTPWRWDMVFILGNEKFPYPHPYLLMSRETKLDNHEGIVAWQAKIASFAPAPHKNELADLVRDNTVIAGRISVTWDNKNKTYLKNVANKFSSIPLHVEELYSDISDDEQQEMTNVIDAQRAENHPFAFQLSSQELDASNCGSWILDVMIIFPS